MKKFISPSLYYFLCLCVLVLAAVFLILSPNEETGKAKTPVACVSVVAPDGYTSLVTEEHITDVLERSISKIPGAISTESVSTAAGCFITVFSDTEDREILQKVKEAVEDSRTNLPQDTKRPEVLQPFANEYTLLYTVESPVLSSAELRHFHDEEMVTQVYELPQVEHIATLGGKQRVLRICPDRYRLAILGLSFSDIYMQLVSEDLKLTTALEPVSTKQSYRPEDIRNFMVHDKNNQAHPIAGICTLTDTIESMGSFSGRMQEAGKVSGIVYYRPRENESEAEARQKILDRLNTLQLPAEKGFAIRPFETGPLQKSTVYPTATKAGLIAIISFLALLLLSIFATLSWKQKALVLCGTGLLFVSVTWILNAKQPEQENDLIHLVMHMDQPEVEKENLAWKLAKRACEDNQLKDLIWFAGQDRNGDPFEKNSIHFYARLKPGANKEKVVKQLYQLFSQVPGGVLTQFPDDNGQRSYRIKVQARELHVCMQALDMVRQKLHTMGNVNDLYTKGNAQVAVREYRISGNRYLITVPREIDDRETGILIKIGCIDAGGQPIDEVLVRDLNQGGAMVAPELVIASAHEAVYHQDRENVGWIGFKTNENTFEQVKLVLDHMRFEGEVKLTWEE